MAVTKAKKIEQIEELSSELKGASSAIVATFNKMTVDLKATTDKLLAICGGAAAVKAHTAPKPESHMATVMDALASLGGKPIETLSPAALALAS
jgi:translation initiation factor 1 (eIF-1/SUI1)